jgi:hypothetical protein
MLPSPVLQEVLVEQVVAAEVHLRLAVVADQVVTVEQLLVL